MRYILLCLIILFISCGNEKELQLPQIDKADITELQDVSAAYLFYDETQPDSVLLNRKNLISTTNWLVNVDKRLTLKQAIPHIKFLQEKKQNSSHKNEKAKNYFTCHDLSKNNLGFLEFTMIVYKKSSIINLITDSAFEELNYLIIYINSIEDIKINTPYDEIAIFHSNQNRLRTDLISIMEKVKINKQYVLCFNENLSFQDYISIKSDLSKLVTEDVLVSNQEFISN